MAEVFLCYQQCKVNLESKNDNWQTKRPSSSPSWNPINHDECVLKHWTTTLYHYLWRPMSLSLARRVRRIVHPLRRVLTYRVHASMVNVFISRNNVLELYCCTRASHHGIYDTRMPRRIHISIPLPVWLPTWENGTNWNKSHASQLLNAGRRPLNLPASDAIRQKAFQCEHIKLNNSDRERLRCHMFQEQYCLSSRFTILSFCMNFSLLLTDFTSLRGIRSFDVTRIDLTSLLSKNAAATSSFGPNPLLEEFDTLILLQYRSVILITDAEMLQLAIFQKQSSRHTNRNITVPPLFPRTKF